MQEQVKMNADENQIVVYQPNETVRLDVRLENETVWLTQSQMGLLFGCTTRNVRLHLENIYLCGELTQDSTRKDFFLVRMEGSRQVRRVVTCYNLDAIISVGYRVNSVQCGKFTKTICGICHDRFIIVDGKEVFWTGASLKDAGRLTFAAAKMGPEIIPGLLASIRKATTERREYVEGREGCGRAR